MHDVVPSDFNFDPFGRIAVTVEDESQVFFTSDRGIDVLCAPQSSIGGAVGAYGKCGVAVVLITLFPTFPIPIVNERTARRYVAQLEKIS